MAATKAGPSRGSGPRTNATARSPAGRWCITRASVLRTGDLDLGQLLDVGLGKLLDLLVEASLEAGDPLVQVAAQREGERARLPDRDLVEKRLAGRGHRQTAHRSLLVLADPDGEALARVLHRAAVVVAQPQQDPVPLEDPRSRLGRGEV